MSKVDGGLGFQDLEAFNSPLLARQLWRLSSNESSLVFRLLKAVYFPVYSMMEAPLGHRLSFT